MTTMTVDSLDSFGQLAKAIGLLSPSGQPNASWFGDPVGSTSNNNGLKHLLADDAQRTALLGFVDEILGPPDKAVRSGKIWVPLFSEADPRITISAVVEEVAGKVHLGIGVEHTTSGGPPAASTRVHVPVFRFARRGGPALTGSGGMPGWLMIGTPGARVGISVDATFTETAPPPGEAALAGMSLGLGIPTAPGDQLSVDFELRGLQLPGATEPRDFGFDASSLAELGTDVFDLVLGLVRAQADALSGIDPSLAPFRAVAGLVGLRNVSGLPALPLADIPVQGVSALTNWVEQVLADNTARDAWLGELADLVGGTVLPADDAVRFTVGPATIRIGVRVQPGAAGHPILVPWVELSLDTRSGARARLIADLLRADTGTGRCTALPDLRAEAVFGADAGGAALLDSGFPHVGSLHAGVALDPTGRPAFVLTLHDVQVTGGSPQHDVLDLSSPSAALDSASTVLEGALGDAIDDLGPAGALVNRLLGLTPPAGIDPLDVPLLFTDPLAAVRAYWLDLTGSPTAAADVLGRLRALITDAALGLVPGTGTAVDPWRVELVEGVELRVWRDGSRLLADLVGSVTTAVLGDHEVTAALGITLLRADLAAGTAAFAVEAHGTLSFGRQDDEPSRIAVGSVELEAGDFTLRTSWIPGRGLRATIAAEDLAVVISGQTRVPLPLPTLDSDGNLVLPTLDWTAIETGLAGLLGELRVPVVDALLDLVGWRGSGAHLSLEGLVGVDPGAAVLQWLTDLVLDCERVRWALGPVAALLSGFRRTVPMGSGTARNPWRCPVAGEPRAPGLAVWMDPGCPGGYDELLQRLGALTSGEQPEPAAIAGVLRGVATALPDVADLMVGRDSLAEGFGLLLERWTGTDGLVGRPSALPNGVTDIELAGFSYDELVALGSAGLLVGDVLDPSPSAVVHVGAEPTWTRDRAAGTAFDLHGTETAGSMPATGGGTWFVRLPSPSTVGEQAARLLTVLAGRTDPVALIGYGACGAAVLRAAATATAVTDAVTVGTPWAGLATDSLTTGLGGDALQLLRRLRRPDQHVWPDKLLAEQATPLEQANRFIGRSLVPVDLPSAGAEARRTGLNVHAVFGSLDGATLSRGLAAYVADGLHSRIAAAGRGIPGGAVQTALHAAVDVPVFDLDLGGLLVGFGTTVELVKIGNGPDASLVRGVIAEIHLGVHDGWLVGGPGSGSTVGDLRWMSARIEVPLDGRPGDAELVLHEATGFGIDRERWVVRALPGPEATAAVPEVRVLLADVVARLRAASPDLAALLDLLGISRLGGLDPDGLDRLLHDTAVTLRGQVALNATAIATRVRALVPEATGSGTVLNWTVGPATIGIDLAAGTVNAGLSVDGFHVDVALGASGATATASLGALDPHAGGLRLVATTSPVASVAVEWAAPGAATRSVALLPSPDATALRDLATVVLPAVAGQSLLSAFRQSVSSTAAPLLDAVLDAVGLLTEPDALGFRAVVVPIGLVQDPGGWLRHAAWRLNPATCAVALLEALVPLVAPGRGPGTGWPLADGVVLDYSVAGDRLRLVLDLALEVDSVTTHVVGGLLIGPDGMPQPTLEVSVDIGGRGLRLVVAPGTDPLVRLTLLDPLLQIYPGGPGIGDALAAAGETILPVVLNAIAAHRTDGGTGVLKTVGQVVFDIGGALDLREGNDFTAAKLTTFATDPAARLTARLPQLVTSGAGALAGALDPGASVVRAVPGTDKMTLEFGAARKIKVVLDASQSVPAVELRADVTIAGVGRLVVERLRLSTAGVDVSVLLGPLALDVGPFELRPLLVVRAGSALGSGRMVGIGLALDGAAARAVEFRWSLDANPPTLVAVSRSVSGETLGTPAEAAQWLLALALSIAGGVVVDGLQSVLTTKAKAVLQGVVFTDVLNSTEVDPALALDLFDPDALLDRLKRLLWNAASAPLSVTIDGLVTIGLVSVGSGTKQLGISLSLAAGQRFTIAEGETKVELEVDATWVNPAVPAGLSIYVLSGTSSSTLVVSPAISVAGIGLRFTKMTGPLLSLGAVSLDGIAVHVYAEATQAGFGGGVNLELAGLAFSPGGGGGGNGVANSIMNDAGEAGPASRPAFSPSIAVQKHPGHPLGVSLRAGPPPGPWWIVIQRQLGPLYLERVGFNTVESGGKVTRISLLFDGRVSIFGLTAAVDQLSISWTGGDVLDIDSWAVDLMGLAISADMAGVSLAGGILKTEGPPVSYVGMLLGRFGVYGLSVFGGYTNDAGNPSFFVFGGINGPIGGPPAFFITGLGGGLGINRGLVIPDDPSRFNEFPFIKALDPAAKPPANPMDELKKLNIYFPPQRGNFWFAAGISFNCFALVDGIAVVAVAFGDGLEINLLGLARMALPRPQAALVSIELGLLARFSTREGVFMIRAALTENSWLLYPEVRLTGGFAFAIWWKGPLAGQFVLTLGGYHPDFHRDGYPEVPRLGLVWRIGDVIVVKGGSYFALTSEALMAGVDVEVTADFGWAWARVAFGAHGIVYFDPFWFEVMAYARISAGIKIKTFLGTISFSISLGARIKVWGPEFSGEATLEVGPCEFTVGFGSERTVEPRTLSWAEFVAKYLEDAGGGTARALSAITGSGTLPASTSGGKSAPSSDGTRERPYEVYAEFEITVVTTVPTARVDVDLSTGAVPVPVVRSDGLPATLGLKPMKAGNLSSTLKIRLSRWNAGTNVWDTLSNELRWLGANLAAAQPRPEGSGLGRDSFPIGAWGAPDAQGLPGTPLPKGDVVQAGNLVRLVAEAKMPPPGPEIDYYRVEASRRPLPLQAGGPARGALLVTASTVPLPAATTVAAALEAAGDQLFAAVAADLPDGVLASGERSSLARASYRGEVSAPPLFGTLADGMAAVNSADATASRKAPGPGAQPRKLRPPILAGYLTSGSGVAPRPGITTVSDGRIKRRVAPTLDSVQARLGAHLPIRMHQVAAPAVQQAETLLSARVPRTEATGTTRSYAFSTSGLATLITNLPGTFLPTHLVATPAPAPSPPAPSPPAPSPSSPSASSPSASSPSASSPSADEGALSATTPDPSIPAPSAPSLSAPASSGDEGAGSAVGGVWASAGRSDGRLLASGEMVVLALPDAAVDVGRSGERPALAVDGAARVTMLRGDGDVVVDTVDMAGGSVPVPPGAALIAVQADGAIASGDGVAGWHVRSRVCSLGSHAALADGCVITSDGGPAVQGAVWVTAAELLAHSAAVRTRFSRPVGTVAIVVEEGDADRLDGTSLELTGARRKKDASGNEIPPTVLLNGDQTVLVYPVDPEAPRKVAVSVQIRSGGDYKVTGVLGGDSGPEELIRTLTRDGVVAATGRILAGTGKGCRLAWTNPDPTRPPTRHLTEQTPSEAPPRRLMEQQEPEEQQEEASAEAPTDRMSEQAPSEAPPRRLIEQEEEQGEGRG